MTKQVQRNPIAFKGRVIGWMNPGNYVRFLNLLPGDIVGFSFPVEEVDASSSIPELSASTAYRFPLVNTEKAKENERLVEIVIGKGRKRVSVITRHRFMTAKSLAQSFSD